MLHEYRFLPAAVKRATKDVCLHVAFVGLAIVLVFVYIFWIEREYPEDLKRHHIFLFLLFPFYAIGAITGKRKETKESILIISPEGIQFNKRPVILFSDIGKIERFSSNLFFIYTRDLKPLISIRNLERQEEFLSAAASFTNISTLEKTPFAFTLSYKLLTNFFVVSLILLQLLSDSNLVITISGIILITFAGYLLKVIANYRKHNSPHKNSLRMAIFILLIACALLIRLIIIGLSYF